MCIYIYIHIYILEKEKHLRKTHGKTERDSDEILTNSQAKNINKIS